MPNGAKEREEPIYLIKTTMEREDYRKFLYTATFLRNKLILPIIALISLVGSLLISAGEPWRSVLAVVLLWVVLFVLSLVAICLRVELRNKQRIKTDRTAVFGSTAILKFYPDCLVIEQPAFDSVGRADYQQFYELLESKDYYIFYLNANQATLIRKKDVADQLGFEKLLREKFAGRYKTTALGSNKR